MPAITHQKRDVGRKILDALLSKYDTYNDDEKRVAYKGLISSVLTIISFNTMKDWYKVITGNNYKAGD